MTESQSANMRAVRWIARKAKALQRPGGSKEARDLRVVAETAHDRRDWPAALAAWGHYLSGEPDDREAWLQHGRALREVGDHEDALASFRAAGALDPGDVAPLVEQAGTHERMLDWRSAARMWQRVLKELETGAIFEMRKPLRQRAYLHLINMHRLAGTRDRAAGAMAKALDAVPSLAGHDEFRLLKAQLERDSRPAESFAVLAELAESMPNRDDVRFDAASLALEVGEYQRGGALILPSLRHGQDISFFRLAMDLAQRRSDLKGILFLFEKYPVVRQSDELSAAVLAGAIKGRDLEKARRLARDVSRRRKALDPIHDLARAYERGGQFGRARLLIRFLMKAWPHSIWHRSHYIRLVARSAGLAAADKSFRALFVPDWSDRDASASYCEAAFFAGEFGEAVRRLRRFLKSHPDDPDRSILLGYALANAEGIDAADKWFEDVSCTTFQSSAALVGLAHMAMRRRDHELTRARWAKVVALYPADTIATVEYARALYQLRDPQGALEVADRRLAVLATDGTMREFRLWLYSVTGRVEQALAEAQALVRYAGPSWPALKHAIRNAAALGHWNACLPWMLDTIPAGTSMFDSKELYGVARELIASNQAGALTHFVARSAVPPELAGWIAPYLDTVPPGSGALDAYVAASRVTHARSRSRSQSGPARLLETLDHESICALIASAANRPTIHIVNKFEQPRGGSELHALDLAERLGRLTEVRLWAPDAPHPGLPQVLGIDPGEARAPKGGVIVLIGIYFDVATWIGRTHPERVIILYNTFEAPSLYEKIDEIFEKTGIRAEIVFCADIMRDECGIDGIFEPSPTDLGLFRPVPRVPGRAPLQIGRHSRDVVEKHDYRDGEVYRAVGALGGVCELLGGTCMQPMFGDIPGLALLPARSHNIAEFLQSLDIFFYRTSTWIEPWGRVVIEAMACGLPCVVDGRSGAAQVITNGVDGFVVSSTEEAIDAITALMQSAELRTDMGARARARVEQLLGDEAIDRLTAFYLLPA